LGEGGVKKREGRRERGAIKDGRRKREDGSNRGKRGVLGIMQKWIDGERLGPWVFHYSNIPSFPSQ